MSNHNKWLRVNGVWLLLVVAILVTLYPVSAKAATNDDFNIQVSPSPLTVTLRPGQRQSASLTVRNLSNHTETLVPHLSGFTIDNKSQKIDLQPTVPLGLDQWITFGQQTLTLGPGASQPLSVVYDTPKNVGFSYSVALTLSPADTKTGSSGATYHASVAVFNLINIDRADAERQLQITSFKASSSRYEYLPATFTMVIKNSGNVIDQPSGNIFIERSLNDTEPIATIVLNPTSSYVLPGTSRTLTETWDQGFPRYVTTNTAGSTGQKKQLSWDWHHVNNLRMGRYVAKAVMVYNDGQRDVPVTTSYTFWVIPWKLIVGLLFVTGLVITGLIAWVQLVLKGTKKVRSYARRR